MNPDITVEELNSQFESIRVWFKTTTEPFDDLEWDEQVLQVWNKGEIKERYTFDELNELLVFQKND